MKTQEALERFLKNCRERGLSPTTIDRYNGYLRHFVTEHPELPTDKNIIERFLQKRKETPARRGPWFKRLQAFYSYLEENEGIKSPVPPKGRVGRPRKVKSVIIPASPELAGLSASENQKLVTGGQSVSNSTSISTREAAAKFLKAKEREGCTWKTRDNYRIVLDHLTRKFEELPLDPGVLDDYLASIKGEQETKHFYFRILRTLYNFLSERNIIPNAMATIRVRQPKQKIRHTLSTEEFQKFLSLPFSPMEMAMYELIAETQIRADELCTLTRENVCSDHIIVQGKTGQRQVPIRPDTYKRLIQLAPSGRLFHSPKGPLKLSYLYTLTRRYLEQIGVKGVKMGPHMLRHSGAVQYLMFGGDVESLRQHLGHKNWETTQIYATMSPAQVRQRHMEVDLLGKLHSNNSLIRAICYCCNFKHELVLDKVKEIRCPNCYQVGKWYLPDVRPEEEGG